MKSDRKPDVIARPPLKSQNRFPNFRAQLSCSKKTRRREPAGNLIYALKSGRDRMSVSTGALAGSGWRSSALSALTDSVNKSTPFRGAFGVPVLCWCGQTGDADVCCVSVKSGSQRSDGATDG
jgi:hypothetical protein